MKSIRVALSDSWIGDSPEENFILNILRKHYEVQISDRPDFLFFSVYGKKHLSFKRCVKVFFSYEICFPNFAYCDYALTLERIEVPGRHFRLPYAWGISDSINERSRFIDPNVVRGKKFCNFVYSNATDGKGARLRQEFCRKLSRYKHVDCPGAVLNNMTDAITPRYGDWIAGKLAFLSNYRFTIAFENMRYPGYTTEKLIQPLVVGSVPIYWGAPDVGLDFNERAFVNSAAFDDDLDAIVDRVIELDQDEAKYLEAIAVPPLRATYLCDSRARELEKFLVSIVERGADPLDKDPRGFAGSQIPLAGPAQGSDSPERSRLGGSLRSIAGSLARTFFRR